MLIYYAGSVPPNRPTGTKYPRRCWQSMSVVHHLLPAADKDPQHVPGVVLTGVVLGILLMWAAIRSMFGKRKK